ncbi:SGNH/GDSL hydrolase family protein [Roseateles sp.]|uniref:SGNH/GDSL hydrolase family protein n=1 Tax=Roseateles sp. TaxID=1971397 RepID=UPI0025F054D1|nr:SGNH/GDSL hydrolase family protein [Roseateles sp.]
MLAPLLLWQGRAVRARALRLPEAEGQRTGSSGPPQPTPEVRPLRLLIVGDSSAAGVGAATQREALAGRLSEELARRTGRAVHWQLLARTGLTSAEACELLARAPLAPADLAVTALGVNDATGRVPPGPWLGALDRIDDLLRRRAGVRFVLHCAVPPMQRFALLPQPLRWWMGGQAGRLNAALAGHLQGRADRALLALPEELQAEADRLMAHDGFHPGPAGYALWARALAEPLARAWAWAASPP